MNRYMIIAALIVCIYRLYKHCTITIKSLDCRPLLQQVDFLPNDLHVWIPA